MRQYFNLRCASLLRGRSRFEADKVRYKPSNVARVASTGNDLCCLVYCTDDCFSNEKRWNFEVRNDSHPCWRDMGVSIRQTNRRQMSGGSVRFGS